MNPQCQAECSKCCSSKTKPHIVAISELWCDGNKELGPSPSEHSFWGPLEFSRVASYTRFHFDEYFDKHQKPGDAALIELCKVEKPDLVFLIWLYSERSHVNPTFETLYKIRYELNIPVIAWWGDTHANFLVELAEMITPFCTKTLSGDSSKLYLNKASDTARYFPLPHPKDPTVFNDTNLERDIDVSFIGTLRGDRAERLNNIRSLGVDVFHTGGQREAKLPISEYARYLQRSKMTINFVQFNGIEYEKVAGRMFEATLCGTLLLEPASSDAQAWFEPMKEYVPYSNDEDLVNKINYYLENPEEREEIAENGRLKCLQSYTGKNFWNKVIEISQTETSSYHSEALCSLAQYWLNRNNLEKAAQYLEKLAKIDKNFAKQYLLKSKILRHNGLIKEAYETLKYYNEISKPDCEIFIELAELAYALKLENDCLEILTEALHHFPDSLEVLSLIVSQFPSRLDTVEVLNFCQSEILKNSTETKTYSSAANLMNGLKLFEQAEQLISAGLEHAKDKARYLFEAGLWWEERGNKRQAKEHYWQSLRPELQKEHAWSVLPDIITLQYQGHWDKAERLVKHYLPFVTIEQDLLTNKLSELRNY
ncbi:MAG: glycosyltransferase [Deltaproteobacteria bacterium]|nr:glycosyltransferase [Deltaproteobacteria bacterium]